MKRRLCRTGAADGGVVMQEVGRHVYKADKNFLYFPNEPPHIANKQQMIKFISDNSQASN